MFTSTDAAGNRTLVTRTGRSIPTPLALEPGRSIPEDAAASGFRSGDRADDARRAFGHPFLVPGELQRLNRRLDPVRLPDAPPAGAPPVPGEPTPAAGPTPNPGPVNPYLQETEADRMLRSRPGAKPAATPSPTPR